MKLHRIEAIFIQEYFVMRHALEVIMDIAIYPLMSVVVFGFLSLYLIGKGNSEIGQSVIMGMLLWQIIFIAQYSIPVAALWNIWSRNLSNLFITPLNVTEYVIAQTISSTVKSFIIVGLSSLICYWIFHFNILSLGLTSLIIIFINFTMFAFALGLMILGLICRYSTRIQSLAWGLLPILQPLMAAIYPVKVLPYPLQILSYFFPPTFTFEAARSGLASHTIDWQLYGISFAMNIIYTLIAIFIFRYMFDKSRDTGQFARNEA